MITQESRMTVATKAMEDKDNIATLLVTFADTLNMPVDAVKQAMRESPVVIKAFQKYCALSVVGSANQKADEMEHAA